MSSRKPGPKKGGSSKRTPPGKKKESPQALPATPRISPMTLDLTQVRGPSLGSFAGSGSPRTPAPTVGVPHDMRRMEHRQTVPNPPPGPVHGPACSPVPVSPIAPIPPTHARAQGKNLRIFVKPSGKPPTQPGLRRAASASAQGHSAPPSQPRLQRRKTSGDKSKRIKDKK